jgi:2-polyprenyl-3-methyl-5-hydroxy-6-metoxy-1,4-benzoquinol methylase
VVIDTIKQKKFKIFAIDIDAGAIVICQKRIVEAGLQEYVHATQMSVTDVKEKYDFVLWMESFPVINPPLFEVLFKHR